MNIENFLADTRHIFLQDFYIILVFFVWSCNPVLNIYWSVVICLVIVYTGFGGSFYININKKPW
jgi:hypothetical protein